MGLKEDIERITRQEEMLVFTGFDENTAYELGTWLRETARKRGWGIVIDIRRFDMPLYVGVLPGATPENFDWARRKSNIVNHFHKSSYRVGRELALKDTTLEKRSGLPVRDYAAHGGAFPIRVRHAGVIGTVAISGLPQRADHEAVTEALCMVLGLDFEDYRLPPEA